jgi:Tfp pilus assembly protein PilO
LKLTSREKKAIVTGIVSLAVVGIFYALTSLLPNRDSLAQTVDLNKRMLLKQRETLNHEVLYKKRVEQYAKQFEQNITRLLPGANPNVASADLQKLLKDFANLSGVEINQTSTQPEKKVPNLDMLTKVSVHIEANCNLEQLVQFLSSIENHDKYLKVEDLNITSWRIGKRQEIRPSITVVGYIYSGEPKPKDKSATGAAAGR